MDSGDQKGPSAKGDRGVSTRFSATNQPARKAQKRDQNLHELLAAINAAPVRVRSQGKKRSMTTDEIFIERLIASALSGNPRDALFAARHLFKLVPPSAVPPKDLNMVIEHEIEATNFRWFSDNREVEQSEDYYANLKQPPLEDADLPFNAAPGTPAGREVEFRKQLQAAYLRGEWTPEWAERELARQKSRYRKRES